MRSNGALESWRRRANAVLPAGGLGNFDPNVIVARGEGAHLWDANGERYVDYLLGAGTMMVGHGHPAVIEAIERQLADGFAFFATSTAAIELAEVICDAIECADRLRYVSSGGEANMYAIRLARAHAKRPKIVKFEGGYHGMSPEALMSLAPTQLAAFPKAAPDGAGILDDVGHNVLVAPFNDLDFVSDLFENEGDRIAGVIVEPVQRMIPPEPGFLEGLRALCDRHGAVLIFDEVVTGFRLAWGGAQERYGIAPDICALGKVIGGGFPLGAIAGKKAIMDHFDKAIVGSKGFVFQMGALNGHPVAAVAGLETLKILSKRDTYDSVRAYGQAVMAALDGALGRAGHAVRVVGDPAVFDAVFTDEPVRDYRGWLAGDGAKLRAFNASLRRRGVLKSPSKFYIGACHDQDDLASTLEAIEAAAIEAPLDGEDD